MSKLKNSRVQSNLLQQNCFVRDVTRESGLVNSSSPDTFLSIDEIVTSKGVELKETDNPYPITPQYVKSFADSADYHRDPLQAITSGSSRQNLGDIRDIQHVSSLDTEQARVLYEQLSKIFSSVPDDSSTATVADDSSDFVNGGDK